MGNTLPKVTEASEQRTKYLVIIVCVVLGVSLLMVFGLFVIISRKKQTRQDQLAKLRRNLESERIRHQVGLAEEVALERQARWNRNGNPEPPPPPPPHMTADVVNVFQHPDYGRAAIVANNTPTTAPGFGYPTYDVRCPAAPPQGGYYCNGGPTCQNNVRSYEPY